MNQPLLQDSEIAPTDEVLKSEFRGCYPVFEEFISRVQSEPYSLSPEWRYYKDGKAWLCKICRKKKTVVWLSAWTDCFKLGFYFTEKSGEDIPNLDICSSLKENFESNKPIGKLKPLVAEVNQMSQLEDVFTLIQYKVGKL